MKKTRSQRAPTQYPSNTRQVMFRKHQAAAHYPRLFNSDNDDIEVHDFSQLIFEALLIYHLVNLS